MKTAAPPSVNGQPAGAALAVLTADQLAELVRRAVAEALAAQQGQAAELRVYTEREAAELLRLRPWQLRDERRRGRIKASRVVGRQVRYTEQDLAQYLARGRADGGE